MSGTKDASSKGKVVGLLGVIGLGLVFVANFGGPFWVGVLGQILFSLTLVTAALILPDDEMGGHPLIGRVFGVVFGFGLLIQTIRTILR